jgi:hypothetical protein
MANALLTDQVFADTALYLAKNTLVMARLVDGQFKNQVTDFNGATISVKKPPRFVNKSDGTMNLALQDVVMGSTTLSVNQFAKTHINFGDIESITSVNELVRSTAMMSAGAHLATQIDGYLAGLALQFNSWVAGGKTGGTGGLNATTGAAPIHSSAESMSAHTRLMNNGVMNDRNINGVVTYDDAELIRGSLLGSYTPTLNEDALERVRIPLISDMRWYPTQQMPVLTTGTRVQGNGSSTGGQISGANQNVNFRAVKSTNTQTLNVTALGAGATISAGEVFTIQGCYAWDGRLPQSLPYLQQFTVLSPATADGSGNATLTIKPAIIVQGTNDGVSTDTNTAYGTVDTLPAANAYIQFVGSPLAKLRQRLVFHKSAIAMVSLPLVKPFSGTFAYATDPDTGISIRYWRQSDVNTGNHIHRWDCAFGAAITQESWGTRITGSES